MMADAPKIWTPDDILWTPSTFAGTERDDLFGSLTGKYCEDLTQVVRRKTRTVTAGPVKFGSEHPIVRQTMGTTSTKDVKGTIEQIMRCADEGFDLVRITVVGQCCIRTRRSSPPAEHRRCIGDVHGARRHSGLR